MEKYINSEKYEGVQYYLKVDGTKSYYVRYRDENNKLKRVKVGNESDGTTEVYCRNKRIEILNAPNKCEQPPKIVKNHRKQIITLDDVANKYFSSKDNSTSTHERLSKYKYIVKNDRKRFLNELEIQELYDACIKYDEENENDGALEYFVKNVILIYKMTELI